MGDWGARFGRALPIPNRRAESALAAIQAGFRRPSAERAEISLLRLITYLISLALYHITYI